MTPSCPASPIKKEGYVGILLLSTSPVLLSRMCMQLDGALNPLPIMSALVVLPSCDGPPNSLLVLLPKRGPKQIHLWLVMMLCSKEQR
jgi:hypothetical protein